MLQTHAVGTGRVRASQTTDTGHPGAGGGSADATVRLVSQAAAVPSASGITSHQLFHWLVNFRRGSIKLDFEDFTVLARGHIRAQTGTAPRLSAVQVRQLEITGAFEFTPKSYPDHRGLFVAPFQEGAFREATGHGLRIAQTNHSVSARGVIRGVHFADVPPGQAKYVYCPQGVLLDLVVDVRVGSPTFGRWEAVRLDATEYRTLYLAEGIGHAFLSLADDTVMVYLCSTEYNPSAEHGINPLDPEIGLPWGDIEGEPILSDKDRNAPSLTDAADAGLLPRYEDCIARYEHLRSVG
jgi:epimerase EvaD